MLDEAQAVKNPETRSARALRSLPAEQHIALTGTPVENRLSELWSIMSMVTPGLLGSLTQFRQRFATPIERNHDLAAAAALRQLTSPFLLRRTKADKSLVPDLPDKVEQLAWASLTREQAGMYQGVVDQLLADAQQATGMRRRGLVLAALTRLKQICNHPAHTLGDGSRLGGRSGKLTRFDELVTDLLDAGEQALVFTQFREMGLLLQRHLIERFACRRRSCTVACLARVATGWSTSSNPARRRLCYWSRCAPAVPASTSPRHRASCTTTVGGTRQWRIRPPTVRGASVRRDPCSCTSWCARARSKNASTR